MDDAVGERVQWLRENNPAAVSIDVPLDRFRTTDHDVIQFSDALNRNEFVSEVVFSFLARGRGNGHGHGHSRAMPPPAPVLNWDPLFRAIESREKLTKVGVSHTPGGAASAGRCLPGLFRGQLLQAVQRNPRVQSLTLKFIDFSNDSTTEGIISYLDSTPHLTDLVLIMCQDESSSNGSNSGGGGGETTRIASALQRNRNIRNLRLDWCPNPFLIPIFEQMASPDSVLRLDKLVLRPSPLGVEAVGQSPSPVWAALQRCLENSKIDCFELDGDAAGLSNITEGLIQSASVKEVVYRNCALRRQGHNNEQCDEKIANLLRKKTNLATLRLPNSDFFRFPKCFDALVEVLNRNDSSLRRLEFDINVNERVAIGLRQFRKLMRIAASSRLEILCLGKIARGRLYFQALAHALPSFKIQVVNLTIQADGWTADSEELLLDGFKNNYVVQRVECKPVDGSRNGWFNDLNQGRLDFFLDRNRKLAQWTANPQLVPPELWAYALNLALKAGVNSLYQSLLAASGDAIGLPRKKSSQKRKRSTDVH